MSFVHVRHGHEAQNARSDTANNKFNGCWTPPSAALTTAGSWKDAYEHDDGPPITRHSPKPISVASAAPSDAPYVGEGRYEEYRYQATQGVARPRSHEEA